MVPLPEPVCDDALFIAWCDGDESAFSSLVDRHGPPLLGFLNQFLRDGIAATDAWSETWVRVISSKDEYTPSGTFRAWLYTLARRAAIDLRRREARWFRLRARLQSRRLRGPAPEGCPEESAAQSQLAQRLGVAIAGLSEEHQLVLLLAYRQGLSPHEIGVTMGGLSGEQVRSRLKYARRLLKERIEE